MHRFPYYAVSIGLEYEGQIVLGVIYDPNRDELFFGRARPRRWLERARRFARRTVTALSHAFVVASLPSAISGRSIRPCCGCCACCRTPRACNGPGSAALNLAYVACGRMDAFWSSSLKPWDVAAGSLLVTEAGGVITRMNGEPFDLLLPDLLATNGPAAASGDCRNSIDVR